MSTHQRQQKQSLEGVYRNREKDSKEVDIAMRYNLEGERS